VCGDRVRLAGKDMVEVPTLNSDGRCPDIGESPMMLLPFVKRKMPYGDGYKYISRYPLVNFSLISDSGICINIYIHIYSPWFLKMETIHQFRG
jgi:hypothetical protein